MKSTLLIYFGFSILYFRHCFGRGYTFLSVWWWVFGCLDLSVSPPELKFMQ